MKAFVVGLLLLALVGCSHVPRTCVMYNPQTGHEVLVSQTPTPYMGWYGVGVAAAKRMHQKDLIEALKARGYEMVHKSDAGL